MRAKRSLGQNFLVSRGVVEKIVGACAGDVARAAAVLEIGPGRGALTGGLQALGRPFFAIEKDWDLSRELEVLFPGIRVAVGDALELDIPHIARETGLSPWLVAGNLPYNAGTEILRRLLRFPEQVAVVVVMLQREVALKFVADSGSVGYGPLGIWTRAGWEGEILFDVPPGAFRPPPKVTSSVCRFAPRMNPPLGPEDSAGFWSFLRGAFRQRRRTLAYNLAEDSASRDLWKMRLESLGFPPDARPAAVPGKNFEELFKRWSEGRPRSP